MTMKLRAAFAALALASSPLVGCSRDEVPPPTPAVAPSPSDAAERARSELYGTARDLQVDDALKQSPVAGESPAALSEQDMVEARKAIEKMLESVKKELEQKSAALGQPVTPNAAPAVPVVPNPSAPQP
jgi:hypothetical protein